MAQRITRLTTDQKIAGSNPAEIVTFEKIHKFEHNKIVSVQHQQIRNKNVISPPGGLEPPTFRLTAERANQLRHGGFILYCVQKAK